MTLCSQQKVYDYCLFFNRRDRKEEFKPLFISQRTAEGKSLVTEQTQKRVVKR